MYLSHARNYGHAISSALLMTNSKIHLAKIKQWIFHNVICLAAWIGHLFRQISVFASLMMVDTLTWNSILPEAVTSLSPQPLPMTAEKQVTGCTKSLVSCRVEIHMSCLPENQHLGWVRVTFLGDFSSLSWAYFLCKWAKILICWCLWPFTVQDHIYGRSNFGHRFCLLALLTKFMVKIWAAINLAQDHKWSIPLASLLPQALTPTY